MVAERALTDLAKGLSIAGAALLLTGILVLTGAVLSETPWQILYILVVLALCWGIGVCSRILKTMTGEIGEKVVCNLKKSPAWPHSSDSGAGATRRSTRKTG